MKTIGLIGGMSWESTVTYYQVLNQVTNEQLGGLHSSKCILYSVDFEEIEECQSAGDWEKSAQILTEAAQSLERAGADFIVICTNTMHKVSDKIALGIAIPILHIAETAAEELLDNGVQTVALLGTKYTMEQTFYKEKLEEKGITILIPDEKERAFINQTIYEELCLGIISLSAKREFLQIIESLAEKGAEAVILGCTEIGLLVSQEDTPVQLFDTTLIHAQKAVMLALTSE